MPATSKSQQRLFSMALAVRKGDLPRSKVWKAVLDIVDSDMTDKEIEEFTVLKEGMTPLAEYMTESFIKNLTSIFHNERKKGDKGGEMKDEDDIIFMVHNMVSKHANIVSFQEAVYIMNKSLGLPHIKKHCETPYSLKGFFQGMLDCFYFIYKKGVNHSSKINALEEEHCYNNAIRACEDDIPDNRRVLVDVIRSYPYGWSFAERLNIGMDNECKLDWSATDWRQAKVDLG